MMVCLLNEATPRDNVWRRFHEQKSEEAMDFLSYVADVSRGWDEPTKGEVGKMKSQLSFQCKAGMYTLKEDDDMKAKLAAMTRRLEELELKKMHEVQAVAEAPVQVKLVLIVNHMNIWWRNALQFQLKGKCLRSSKCCWTIQPNNNALMEILQLKLEESSKFLMEGQSNSVPTAGSTISTIFKS
ncbi:hypothetical protein CK203_066132 [Vitis vinifera]|uniref:Uncharacterized protein n=1 Tax=Vitis vinifera TaxID=29760 RepID=A0A438G3Q7_VITVI|nr:hypothetical protein CK203_066132 [Vitis vinifera]